MILVAFGIIGLLTLFLIYFVLRIQNLQRELALTRHSVKQSNSKVNYAYHNLVLVTDALEKAYISRIESAFKSKLIEQNQYNALHALMRNFSTVVMLCNEKGATLEEALKKALASESTSFEDVIEVVKALPSNVRMAWSKNTADGFINFCQLVTNTASGNNPKAKPAPSQPAQA